MGRKEEILSGLGVARQRILEKASGLSAEKLDETFLGTWSIKDLLAHLVGWDYANIQAVKDIRNGITPRVFEHWDENWVTYNAALVEQHGQADFDVLLAAIQESHQALLDFVSALPAEDIQRDFGIRSPNGTNITIEWFLQFEVDDEGRHYDQVKAWLG
jgi:uncharacterized damage-inducible protein DinB